MQIVHAATEPREFFFDGPFLAPYYAKGDPFKTILARSTYVTKYARSREEWTDTIRRVVEGNVALSHVPVSRQEAELLFHLFWTGQALPPGRGLWTGGVPGIPADARYNCWYTTLYGTEDWCWMMNQLMLGGGVGIGLGEIDKLPSVAVSNARFAVNCVESHPDINEVKPNDKSWLNGSTPVYRAEDSRGGWVESLRRVFVAAWEGRDFIVDVSPIRPRGQLIRTFGGIACGPGPLTHLLRSTWEIVRGAAGRKLTSVECLDITNLIGFCVKSGNVRRSALIVLGDAHDQPFRDAKKDFEKVKSHRHTSNNSIIFRSWDQIRTFDWKALVDDNITFGEPGIFNLPKVWETDPGAKGVNPCGEQALHDREACNLGENFPANYESGTDADTAFRLQVRYCMRQRLTPLTDPQSHEVGRQNMRVGVALGGLCDFDWTPEMLAGWYSVCREEANSYADELRVNRPLTVTTVKPSGTISLLNGSSPGIHAPYAPFYIRRARIAKNDPMAPALIEAGVPYEDDQYDNTNHTYVFSFPTKARHTRITVQNETIRDQFERQALVQKYWADNAVSATLSFDPETERELTAELLEEYVPHFKSTAMLAKSGHGYVQAPYEACSEHEYTSRASQIRHDHPLVRGGDLEIEECSGGACPIR
jgi:ribonucleoside-triphosphate reductase (thioredoxin)